MSFSTFQGQGRQLGQTFCTKIGTATALLKDNMVTTFEDSGINNGGLLFEGGVPP
jgi:hypothetical protein